MTSEAVSLYLRLPRHSVPRSDKQPSFRLPRLKPRNDKQPSFRLPRLKPRNDKQPSLRNTTLVI
ncbi:MAG: hypothetical protein Q7U00_06510 [Sulfurimonas sp.]|nr:hypothetical protein [Sulfurimonas sp.]